MLILQEFSSISRFIAVGLRPHEIEQLQRKEQHLHIDYIFDDLERDLPRLTVSLFVLDADDDEQKQVDHSAWNAYVNRSRFAARAIDFDPSGRALERRNLVASLPLLR